MQNRETTINQWLPWLHSSPMDDSALAKCATSLAQQQHLQQQQQQKQHQRHHLWSWISSRRRICCCPTPLLVCRPRVEHRAQRFSTLCLVFMLRHALAQRPQLAMPSRYTCILWIPTHIPSPVYVYVLWCTLSISYSYNVLKKNKL